MATFKSETSHIQCSTEKIHLECVNFSVLFAILGTFITSNVTDLISYLVNNAVTFICQVSRPHSRPLCFGNGMTKKNVIKSFLTLTMK